MNTRSAPVQPSPRPRLSPWRFVVVFGVVSLLADVVYEGARSVTGPLLASLGASATVVGVVTGAGEAAALLLRLVSGPLADRSGRFWDLATAGYALTVLTVPFLGLAGALGTACVLVVAERAGKAIRSPSKDTLLSHATAATGRGKGFAVHEALDQVGAVTGPLVVAGMLALTGDDYGPSLLVLAVPGLVTLVLLAWLRRTVPEPAAYERATGDATPSKPVPFSQVGPATGLPRRFWTYAAFTAMTMSGFATFGVIAYHLVHRHLLGVAAVPLVYAGTMAAGGLASLATGWWYDRSGPAVLTVLPVLAALVPVLAFTGQAAPAVVGALLWGAATGVQESTLRATVADLVPSGRRATAYGVFAAVVGGGAFVGGALTGALYSVSVPALLVTVAVIQAGALVLLAVTRPGRQGV